MLVLRILVVAVTLAMTVLTLFLGVTVLLGVGWLTVAVPVVIVIGIIAAVRALWRRLRARRPPPA